MPQRGDLGRRILSYIQRTSADWGWRGPGEDPFTELVKELFAAHLEAIPAYAALCRRQGVDPSRVQSWWDVPAVATDAFKVAWLSTVPEGEAARVFLTSGTTQGARGRHGVPSLDWYDAAMEAPFLRHLLPEGTPLRFLTFTPPQSEDPWSSLGYMVDHMAARWAAPGSRSYQAGGVMDFAGAWRDLEEAQELGAPVLLLGSAFAWVHLLDVAPDRRVSLPVGSRLMETGGFKGRSREVSRPELRAWMVDRLGLAADHIVGEYGMTELSSQLWEGGLRAHVLGEASPPGFFAPPWMRVGIVDPVTLAPVPDGQVGLVRFYDLANVGSAPAVLTADLGRLNAAGGLELVGRASGAEARGCSLQVEELMAAMGQGGQDG